MRTPDPSTTSNAVTSRMSVTSRTPAWKIALIPLLTIVLVWNLSAGDQKPLEATTAAENTAAENTAAEKTAAEKTAETVSTASLDSAREEPGRNFRHFDANPWPAVDSAKIAEFDPFALDGELAQRSILPSAVEKPLAAAIDEDLTAQQIEETLSNLQLQGILNGSNGPAALVNSRIVRIGDEIQPGLRVVEITSAGIVVEPVNSL